MGYPATASPYLPYFQEASTTYGVPEPILVAMAQQESSMGVNLYGQAGELGIMQTGTDVVQNYHIGNPLDPHQDIDGAAAYLATLYQKTGNWTSAVAAYNGSGTAASTYAGQVMAQAQNYGYQPTGADTSSTIWNYVQQAARTIGLDPVGTSSSNISQGNAPGKVASATVGGIRSTGDLIAWVSKNWVVVLTVAAAGVVGIFAISDAFKSPSSGGTTTKIVPVPV